MGDATIHLIIGDGTKTVGVIIFFFIAMRVAKLARNLAMRAIERSQFDQTLTKIFGSGLYWMLMTLSIIAALGVFGIETTSFAAMIGGASVAIGMALQGSLSNLAAGVMLLVFKPFKVGDAIKVAGVTGGIDEIELFATILTTPDNRRIILPNSAVFGATIEHMTYYPTRRVDVNVGTDEELTAAIKNALDGANVGIPYPQMDVHVMQAA